MYVTRTFKAERGREGPAYLGPCTKVGHLQASLKLDEQDSNIFTGWSVATVLMQ